jgi:hypothetical protein
MKRTLITTLVAVAGLAATAFAQRGLLNVKTRYVSVRTRSFLNCIW